MNEIDMVRSIASTLLILILTFPTHSNIANAAVGDVYYCVTKSFAGVRSKDKKFTFYNQRKFSFKMLEDKIQMGKEFWQTDGATGKKRAFEGKGSKDSEYFWGANVYFSNGDLYYGEADNLGTQMFHAECERF